MFFSRSVLVKYVLAILCSFYLTLVLHNQLRFHIFTLVLLSLLFCVLTFHLLTYLIDKCNNRALDKKIAFISLGIGAFLLIAVPKSLNLSSEPDNYALIKITALGERNDSSHSSEVWISRILNKGVDYKPVLTTGWEERYNQIVSFYHQPSTLTLKIDDPILPEIIFAKHTWAGKVKIEGGSDTTIIDLYSTKKGQSYKYTTNKVFPNQDKYSPAQATILIIICLLALTTLSYVSILFARIKNNYFLLSVPLCIAAFFPEGYLELTLPEKLIILALTIGCCFIVPREKANKLISEFTSRYKLIAFIVLVYAGLAFIGHRLFFAEYPLRHFVNRLAFCFLFCGWFLFIALVFLYLTELCKRKIAAQHERLQTPYSPVKLYLFFSAILLACWAVYLAVYFPGNMSADSIDQWYQATGVYHFTETHPVIHTLLLRFLISIWHSPAIVAISQMLTLAAACSSFLIYLYKAGIPLKWLLLTSFILGIIPANGILPVILWKDTVFCCAVLWATLTITELVTDIYIFNYRTTLVCLTISLVSFALFRHNGILAAFVTMAFLFAWAIKKRKRPVMISVAVSVMAIFAYKYILVARILKVPPVAEGIELAIPVHGLAAVKYYDGGYLTKETQEEMRKLLPDSTWISHFQLYNGDPYLYYSGTEFIKNLSKVPASKVLRMYATALKDNPYIIPRERFCSSELLWNVTMAKGSFDYTYSFGIDKNNSGLKQVKNRWQPVMKKYLDFTVKKFQPVLWRPGIYNILLGLLFFSFIKLRRKYFLIFLPVFATNLSLIIAMSHQSFRYVYYVPLVFGFIWLLAISNALTPAKIKNNINTP